ncbi:hypothetical protein DL96DRAFT_1551279 [Flagelloscypha sp. PMI_526]|nr:hypothetical protein DL96DRAFT_1551279 [Flagelloscypha sp. PMI_526]
MPAIRATTSVCNKTYFPTVAAPGYTPYVFDDELPLPPTDEPKPRRRRPFTAITNKVSKAKRKAVSNITNLFFKRKDENAIKVQLQMPRTKYGENESATLSDLDLGLNTPPQAFSHLGTPVWSPVEDLSHSPINTCLIHADWRTIVASDEFLDPNFSYQAELPHLPLSELGLPLGCRYLRIN